MAGAQRGDPPQDGDQADERADAQAENSGVKPLESSIALERSFRIDGKKVVVQVVLPATLAKAIGMEAMLSCAQRLHVTCDSKQAKVVPLKLGEN